MEHLYSLTVTERNAGIQLLAYTVLEVLQCSTKYVVTYKQKNVSLQLQ